MHPERVLVTGAGGFIGHYLTKVLVGRGYWVRGVDLKYPEYEESSAHEFELLDLRRWADCLQATRCVQHRSEERRVGKECRGRLWQDHQRTKEQDIRRCDER